MTCEIEWKPAEGNRPDDDRRVLIAGPGGPFIGHADKWDSKPCFVNDAGFVVHGVYALADVPPLPPPQLVHGASGSSDVSSISGNTSL